MSPTDERDANPFSTSYAVARDRFLAAARRVGLAATAIVHPQTGRDGEPLALDVVVDGAPDARDWLVVSSGCHGVEGYCGSGIQTVLLGDAGRRAAARAAGVSLLHLHALNPHGFSWQRRTTEDNVDLNRNFQDFDRPLPDNPGYRALHPLLVPEHWPPPAQEAGTLDAFVRTHGMAALQAAVTRGQHEFSNGLFFGGTAATWSNRALRGVLRGRLARAVRIAWIDVHTGLGPCGVGERIFASRDDPAALARARAWWGDPITSIYDGSSTSAFLTGLMFEAVYAECPQAEYTGIALEFGTAPIAEVLEALRGDQWLAVRRAAGEAVDPALAEAIRRRLFAAFIVDTEAWRTAVLEQGLTAVDRAVAGLAGGGDRRR